MKFRTTILLIVFSFTLLLLWNEWISYNTKTLVSPETDSTDRINTPVLEENEYSSELPSVSKLEAKKTAPVEKVVKDDNAGELLVLENSKLRVILTEKPSVAKEIAYVLGARKRSEGFYEGNRLQVTWAYGHLVGLKEPHEYSSDLKKWSLSTLPFIPQDFKLKQIGYSIGFGYKFKTVGNQIDFTYYFGSRDYPMDYGKENIRRFNIAISIADIWFIKRRQR